MSPQITYDVGDVEEFEGYAGDIPKRGVYDCVVRSADFRESKGGHNMFEIIVVLDSKEKDKKAYNGCPLWQYYVIGDLSEEWMKRNMKGVAKVFLSGKDKGKFDPVALAKKMAGTKCRVVVKNETSDEFGLQAKANGLLPAASKEAAESGAEDEDEEEATVTEEEEETTTGAEEEEEEGTEEEEEEEGTTVEEDIADLDRAGLKAYIKENEEYLQGKVKVFKSDSDDDIRTKILEAWPSEEEEEDGEEEEDTEPPF